MLFTALVRETSSPGHPDALEVLARACSPRVEMHGSDAVVFDAHGLSRVCGPPDVMAREIVQLAEAQGLGLRVATAGTRTAAWLLAHSQPGITIAPSGQERAVLSSVSVGWLAVVIDLDQGDHIAPSPTETRSASGQPALLRGRRAQATRHYRVAPPPEVPRPSAPAVLQQARQTAESYRQCFATFERWGLRTLGDIAALPRPDVHARMGPVGVRLHQAACGEDIAPLVPVDEPRPFADRLELEWPIDGLEPLSFVLSRQCDRLALALEQADRGAVTVTTRLRLVTRETHERTLHLPAPMRDARVLRTLILLDLESHPPAAGIDVVELMVEVTPGPILQGSLLAPSLPTPEDVTTLVARLGALMGESRVGSPHIVDTHDARAVAMRQFDVPAESRHARVAVARPAASATSPSEARSGCRRLRVPLAARVVLERGRPVRVVPSGRELLSGAVVASAGPWRTSGSWWTLDRPGWDRDEWDVQLATGGVYRLACHRATNTWEIEGIFD
ncbi:MAG: hypothetical protein ABI051_11110 [Vicinamibacterales bacterium]